ncbi:MAG: DNA-binding protein [Sandaracinaceae bacterium]|jgi:hypothetical protein|nr:DNA-binding protein [Sandaracinaceae bacterium]
MTNREIEARVAAFVADLDGLVRRAALEAVQSALGGAKPAPAAKPAAAKAAKPAAKPVAKKKGAKRDPAALAKLVDTVKGHIGQHPGEGVEVIAKHLGVSSKELALPISKLLESKAITKKGEKRATKYFPAGKK